jgi:Mrp family chromosome partitioning ATPase
MSVQTATVDASSPTQVGRSPGVDSSMRGLLARLRLERATDETPQVIGVTACESGAGATWVAAQLSLASAAEGDGPTVLVEAGLPAAWLPKQLGFERGPALAHWADGRCGLSEILQRCEQRDLWALPAAAAGGVCDGAQLQRLFGLLREEYPLTVVDLPPLTDLAAAEAASACDGVLLVVRAHHTRWQVADRARRLLEAARAPVWGVVFNRRRLALPAWLYRLA